MTKTKELIDLISSNKFSKIDFLKKNKILKENLKTLKKFELSSLIKSTLNNNISKSIVFCSMNPELPICKRIFN